MAMFEVRAVIEYGDRSWQNVWHVDTGAADDVPSGLILALETFQRAMLLDIYTLARIVRRPLGSTDEFIEVVVNAAGTRTTGSAIPEALWTVVKIFMSGGVGRPGFKLLRGFLLGSDVINAAGLINGDVLASIQTAVNVLFNAASDDDCTFVFGADNRAAVSGIVDGKREMRQLHRKRKKTA